MSKLAAQNQHCEGFLPISTFMLAFFLFLLFALEPPVAFAQAATPGKSSSGSAALVSNHASQTQIDANIPEDESVEKMLEPYSSKVRALSIVVGKLEGGLRKDRTGAGTLGNFVTDAVKAQASRRMGRSVSVVVVNSGGLRKSTIAEGDLRASDIFELLPFENELVEVTLTGEQLLKLLKTVLIERDAQSGARIKYRQDGENGPQLLSATLIAADGKEKKIQSKKRYSVVTIDYLLQRGGGKYSVLQAGKVNRLNVTIRDSLIEYVRSETAAGRVIKVDLDGRFASIHNSSNR